MENDVGSPEHVSPPQDRLVDRQYFFDLYVCPPEAAWGTRGEPVILECSP